MLLSNALRRTVVIELPDLGAGADVAGEVIWRAPQGGARINRATVIFKTATAGVDGANTLQVDLNSPAGEFFTTGALAVDQAAGTQNTAVPTVNNRLTEGQIVTLDITQGANADIGRAEVELEYTPLVDS